MNETPGAEFGTGDRFPASLLYLLPTGIMIWA
jgi:hypothetical protein